MTKYDELKPLFGKWRASQLDQYRKFQMLPRRVASALKNFLQCPDFFYGDIAMMKDPVKYVSPCSAVRNHSDSGFKLSACDNSVPDVDFDHDGYFYFGVRIFLESEQNSYPKVPFWFLIRAELVDDNFDLFLPKSQKKFIINSQGSVVDDVFCAHIFEVLKEEVSKDPVIGPNDKEYKIGFI